MKSHLVLKELLTLVKVFSDDFKTIYCLLVQSSVAVRLSLRHFLVKFGNNRLQW